MAPFIFRPARIKVRLAVDVGLFDIARQQPMPDRISATVVNLSVEGACLMLPKLAIDGEHLFFSTLHSKQYNLILFTEENGAPLEEFPIVAESISMDSCEFDKRPSYSVGIKFEHKQSKLFKRMKRYSS